MRQHLDAPRCPDALFRYDVFENTMPCPTCSPILVTLRGMPAGVFVHEVGCALADDDEAFALWLQLAEVAAQSYWPE
jgi:hypothetical protein